jgi:hypothetical protein
LLSSATAADISPLLDQKIEETSPGIPASYSLHLRSMDQNNAKVIVDYIVTMKSEVNLSDHYRRDLIERSYPSSLNIMITNLSKI